MSVLNNAEKMWATRTSPFAGDPIFSSLSFDGSARRHPEMVHPLLSTLYRERDTYYQTDIMEGHLASFHRATDFMTRRWQVMSLGVPPTVTFRTLTERAAGASFGIDPAGLGKASARIAGLRAGECRNGYHHDFVAIHEMSHATAAVRVGMQEMCIPGRGKRKIALPSAEGWMLCSGRRNGHSDTLFRAFEEGASDSNVDAFLREVGYKPELVISRLYIPHASQLPELADLHALCERVWGKDTMSVVTKFYGDRPDAWPLPVPILTYKRAAGGATDGRPDTVQLDYSELIGALRSVATEISPHLPAREAWFGFRDDLCRVQASGDHSIVTHQLSAAFGSGAVTFFGRALAPQIPTELGLFSNSLLYLFGQTCKLKPEDKVDVRAEIFRLATLPHTQERFVATLQRAEIPAAGDLLHLRQALGASIPRQIKELGLQRVCELIRSGHLNCACDLFEGCDLDPRAAKPHLASALSETAPLAAVQHPHIAQRVATLFDVKGGQ